MKPTLLDQPRGKSGRTTTQASCSLSMSEALASFAVQQGVSLFSLQITTLIVLLSRHCNTVEIDLAVFQLDQENQLNKQLIPFACAPSDPFCQLLTRVNGLLQESAEENDSQAQVPLAKPRHLNGLRGALDNTTPSFTVSITTAGVSEADKADLLSPNNVNFEFHPTPEGAFELCASYDLSIIDTGPLSRFVSRYPFLLKNILERPDQVISELAIMGTEEREKIVYEWTATEAPWPRDKSIPDLFEQQVKENPDNIALIQGPRQLSYQQLFEEVLRLSDILASQGVTLETPVALFLERSIETVVAIYAVLRVGGYYVPIEPDWPRDRIESVLADVQPLVLITHDALPHDLLPAFAGEILNIDDLPPPSPGALSQLQRPTPTSAIYCLYTSGTTGKPKGILVEHAGVVSRSQWLQDQFPLSSNDRVLNKTPYGFGVSEWEYFWALPHGATLVIATKGEHKDPGRLLDLMVQEKIKVSFFVPSMLAALLSYMTQKGVTSPPSFTHMFTCGEALTPETCSHFFSRFMARLTNLYGPTEADITSWECPRQTLENPLAKVLIGKPISNVKTYILDQYNQPTPVGVLGELCFGGTSIARGYLGLPDLTNQKFIPNPHAAGRLFKTGDKALWLPDGNIEFLGRVDNQVKIRGLRIELSEIEWVLKQHPFIRESVVIAREDTPGDKRLVAYICFAQDQPTNINELRPWLKKKLPDYMVPATYVPLDSLPLTSNGKVDRRALPAPNSLRPDLEIDFIAPQTPEEEIVARIWAEVLNIDQVGIHDNFFELGGHSLLATQVISRLNQSFQMDLPLRSLFEWPTIAGLAKSVGQARQTTQKQQTPPIERRIQAENLPLSFAQQRLWFVDQLQPGNPAYNISSAYRLTGRLNKTALEQAFNEIVRRHEILRTTFSIADGEPIQVIAPTLALVLNVIDFTDIPAIEREAQTKQVIAEDSGWEFNLAQGLLLRITLLVLEEKEHLLVLTIHHSIFDGWSQDVLLQELSTLYEAFSAEKPSPLPELPFQYTDFAIWQREWLQGEMLEEQLAYWKQQLDGAPPLLELPSDHPRPTIQSFRGATQSLMISETLARALKDLSRQAGATLYMTLLAAFKVLLFRYSGQGDIVVGSPIANRNLVEVEDLIGFFVNTLVIRTNLSDNPTFQELLSRVRQVTLDAYTHQDLPFEDLVEELQPERSLSHSPVFQVFFQLNNMSTVELNLQGITSNPLEVDLNIAKFDLTLVLTETEQGLRGEFEYNTDLFDTSTILRMMNNFLSLLDGIVAKPQQKIQNLPILTKVEEHQILVEWNSTQAAYPKEKCIHQLFETQVDRTPDAIAVIYENQQLTYRELNERANQLAHYLVKLGVEPEVLVGICVERSAEMVIGLLAVLKAGGAYLPLDPAYPQNRLAFMVTDSQAQILLTQTHLTTQFANIDNLQIVCLDTNWDTVAQENEANPITEITAKNLAYVVYTSGSTGTPKGVAGLHQGTINRINWMWQTYPFEPQEICCQKTTLSFVDSIWEIFGPLLQGIQTIIIPDDVLKDPPQLIQTLATHRVTRIVLVPSLLQVILETYPDLSGRLPYLKLWVTSGETLSVELAQHFQKSMPHSALVNLYGSSEVSADSTWYHTKKEQSLSCVPIGRPIANTQIYILDTCLQPVPIGVPGELHVGGDGIARGYLNRPKLTAEKFVSDPFSDRLNARLYKTGDLARYMSDGNIEFLGRIDNQVKIRGFRIELGEIERVLDQHSAIQESVVTALQDELGDRRLVAYVCFASGQILSISELRTMLKQKLPNYMVPSTFVPLDSLPLNSNGKIDRHELPVPRKIELELGEAFVAPQDDLELQLVKIWERVLNITPIGIRDNFFDLGGHSLLAVLLFTQIEKTFGNNLPLATLFQAPTIEEMANILRNKGWSPSWASLVSIQPRGSKPPLFAIHAVGGNILSLYGLAHHLGPDQPFYGLQSQGLEGIPIPPGKAEDTAAHYLEEIRTIQPEGPYFLIGQSGGGVIAYEIAQQLYAQGQEVVFLSMIDTLRPGHFEQLKASTSFQGKFLFYLSNLLRSGPIPLMKQMKQRLKIGGKRLRLKFSRIVNRVYLRAGHPLPHTYRYVVVEDNIKRSINNYTARPFPGRLVLFRSSKHMVRYINNDHDPDRGWDGLAVGGMEIHEIPGNHNLEQEPSVGILAAKLNECLAKARTNDKVKSQE